jgi:hypothetical protein
VQHLDARDLHPFARPSRKSGLDNAVIDAGIMQLPRRLPCQLAAMVEE